MSTGRSQILAVQGTVLDLGVNFASERGLLGIATYPNFPSNPGVYLYWTCRSTALPADPFFPDETRCLDANMFTADTEEILQVPLLGNRVDRFVWNGSSLDDPRLEDRVADNLCKFDLTESESLLIGQNFDAHRYSHRTQRKPVPGLDR